MKDTIIANKYERDQLLAQPYILRSLAEIARKSIASDLIKVIIGPRRAGKSVFAMQLLKDVPFAYVNFDDERFNRVMDYDDIVKNIKQVYGNTQYLLFDEIQNLDRWELFVNRLQRIGYKMVITGSNSRLLSRELATHLTGRYVQFQILPFSFSEYLQAMDIKLSESVELKQQQGMMLFHLNEYASSGGYPEVIIKKLLPREYCKLLLESVLLKDIVRRYNVRYSQKLYELAAYVLSIHSMELSYSKLKNILSFRSVHTVENYLSYLEESFISFFVKRFSYKLKEQIKAPRKTYAYDNGIINAFSFKMSPDTGKLIENLVAIELQRRAKDLFYYRDERGTEIDFLIREGSTISQMIQVCYDLKDPAVKKRECIAFLKASERIGCHNFLVITWDFEAIERYRDARISFIPLWKWLLEQVTGFPLY